MMLTYSELIYEGTVSPLSALRAAVRLRETGEEEGLSSDSERKCGVRPFLDFVLLQSALTCSAQARFSP